MWFTWLLWELSNNAGKIINTKEGAYKSFRVSTTPSRKKRYEYVEMTKTRCQIACVRN